MHTEPLQRELADPGALERTDEPSCEAGIALPTVAQLADPGLVPAGISRGASRCRPGGRASLNLFHVCWHNGANRVDPVDVPGHVVRQREPTRRQPTRRKP